jgi:hypothetical protein
MTTPQICTAPDSPSGMVRARRSGASPQRREFVSINHKLTLTEAKERLTINQLWVLFNLPGDCKSCRCPWRDDQKPSFSVYSSGRKWHDFGTGESGDAIDFLARITHLERRAACRKFVELAPNSGCLSQSTELRTPLRKRVPRRLDFTRFHKGDEAEFCALARLRSVAVEAVHLVSHRELLVFGQVHGFDSWIVTDREQISAQARRMDGMCYPRAHSLTERKAHTLAGSLAAWPIGTPNVLSGNTVLFVEGGPDLLAGHHFVYCEKREADCVVVAMLGSSQRIDSRALPSLAAAPHVRFFPHLDQAGSIAAYRWASQLKAAGASKLDAFSFAGLLRADGKFVNDLNDAVFVDADTFEEERSLWRVIP